VYIPQGISLHGPCFFAGLDGNMIINFHQNSGLGIFHFSTITIAQGNIILFERETLPNNDIVLRINLDLSKNE